MSPTNVQTFMTRIVQQISQEQALSTRMILAIGLAWKGALGEDDFRKLVELKIENEKNLETLAAEMSVAMLEDHIAERPQHDG